MADEDREIRSWQTRRALDAEHGNLGGGSSRPITQGIKKQVIETHFFRAANGDSADGGPCMPLIRISDTGAITVIGAVEEWWGSVYDPVLHANGYILRVVAGRRWKSPWKLETANIFPLGWTVEANDQ